MLRVRSIFKMFSNSPYTIAFTVLGIAVENFNSSLTFPSRTRLKWSPSLRSGLKSKPYSVNPREYSSLEMSISLTFLILICWVEEWHVSLDRMICCKVSGYRLYILILTIKKDFNLRQPIVLKIKWILFICTIKWIVIDQAYN